MLSPSFTIYSLFLNGFQWGTTTGHGGRYDVTDFVFVAKHWRHNAPLGNKHKIIDVIMRRLATKQNDWRHNASVGNKHKISDVVMTDRFYHVTSISTPLHGIMAIDWCLGLQNFSALTGRAIVPSFWNEIRTVHMHWIFGIFHISISRCTEIFSISRYISTFSTFDSCTMNLQSSWCYQAVLRCCLCRLPSRICHCLTTFI